MLAKMRKAEEAEAELDLLKLEVELEQYEEANNELQQVQEKIATTEILLHSMKVKEQETEIRALRQASPSSQCPELSNISKDRATEAEGIDHPEYLVGALKDPLASEIEAAAQEEDEQRLAKAQERLNIADAQDGALRDTTAQGISDSSLTWTADLIETPELGNLLGHAAQRMFSADAKHTFATRGLSSNEDEKAAPNSVCALEVTAKAPACSSRIANTIEVMDAHNYCADSQSVHLQ